MADLLSGMNLTAISRDLSKLAEVCLEAALKLAASETAKRYGGPESVPVLRSSARESSVGGSFPTGRTSTSFSFIPKTAP